MILLLKECFWPENADSGKILMKPIYILNQYYTPGTKLHAIMMRHARQVTAKALQVAARVKDLKPDLKFIEEAAMLHDIGIFLTNTPQLGCHGTQPYILHGYLGGKILKKHNLPKHALVCERHVGVGLSKDDIKSQGLDLPFRDMLPVSLEEQIICYADKFFSKSNGAKNKAKSLDQIINSLEPYGKDKVERFKAWVKLFS